MATDRFYIEKIIPKILSIIIGIITYFTFWKGIEMDKFNNTVDKVKDSSFIMFGILLAVLAIFLQSSKIDNTSHIYTRMIKYNRSATYLSLSLGVLSIIINQIIGIIIFLNIDFVLITYSIMIICLIVDTLYYMHLFYKMALNKII